MDDDAMHHFPVPDRGDLPGDLRERIDGETERANFMLNVFVAFTYEPSHLRPFFGHHGVLIEDIGLKHHEMEVTIMAVSDVNHCYYCNIAHGALVRIHMKDSLLTDQLTANYHIADTPEKHKTMFDVAVKLTELPVEVGGNDLQRLRDAGFSEEAIWDIDAVTAFFSLSNHMAMFAGMRPSEEFHTLGREPRDDWLEGG